MSEPLSDEVPEQCESCSEETTLEKIVRINPDTGQWDESRAVWHCRYCARIESVTPEATLAGMFHELEKALRKDETDG